MINDNQYTQLLIVQNLIKLITLDTFIEFIFKSNIDKIPM